MYMKTESRPGAHSAVKKNMILCVESDQCRPREGIDAVRPEPGRDATHCLKMLRNDVVWLDFFVYLAQPRYTEFYTSSCALQYV